MSPEVEYDMIMKISGDYRKFLEEYLKSHEMSKREAFENLESARKSFFANMYQYGVGVLEKFDEEVTNLILKNYQAYLMMLNALKELGWADDD